ncbi:MAG TPA: hypothetical protein VNO50_16455 [Pyrinomonadaceae bacterium]|jgi:hypothetical protein|nr:hypothetical protein [Pyrinomonadaceae bacterium]
MAVSFSNDIQPLFSQFKGQMMWRFDLTNYDHVKANAALILSRINDPGYQMPPPPMDPLTPDQIQLFQQWINDECPP